MFRLPTDLSLFFLQNRQFMLNVEYKTAGQVEHVLIMILFGSECTFYSCEAIQAVVKKAQIKHLSPKGVLNL